MFYAVPTIIVIICLYCLGSKLGLIQYHALVRFCCRADSHADITNHIITINRFLPDHYKIWTHETTAFQAFYMDYRAWLSDCYIKQSLSSALVNYHSIFAFTNRKIWNTKALAYILQGTLKEGMFLLETLDHYFYLRETTGITGKAPFYSRGTASEQSTLTDLGQVAYKIHLSALTARNLTGYTNEHEIQAAQALLAHSCPIPPT